MDNPSYGHNEVPTNWGRKVLNAEGRVDDTAKDAFLRGQCHSFALAMHGLTGWPIFGVGYGAGHKSPSHFLIYCPDTDDYLDIDGPEADVRYAYLFRQEVSVFNAEETRNPPSYLPCFPEKALPFVRTVLADFLASERYAQRRGCYQRHLTASAGL